MEWVWILIISLVVIVAIGLAIKRFLKKRLDSIDGMAGIHKGDDEDEKIIGKF